MRSAIGSGRMVGIPKGLFDDMADIICAACHDRQSGVEGPGKIMSLCQGNKDWHQFWSSQVVEFIGLVANCPKRT